MKMLADMADRKKSVLFVCTANQYRSPFAAAIFSKQLEDAGVRDQWRVGSAGTWVKEQLPASADLARRALELNLNLSKHVSHEVNADMLALYRVIIVMARGHKEALGVEFPETRERTYMLSEIVDHIMYDIPDPAMDMDSADSIFDELYRLMQRGYSEIVRLIIAETDN